MIPSMPAREMEMKKAGALKSSTLQIEIAIARGFIMLKPTEIFGELRVI